MIRAMPVDSFPVSCPASLAVTVGPILSPAMGADGGRARSRVIPGAARTMRAMTRLERACGRCDADPAIVTPLVEGPGSAVHADRCTASVTANNKVHPFSRRDMRPSSANDHAIKESSPPGKRGRRSAERRNANHLPRNISKRRRLLMYRRQVYAVCATHPLRGCAPYRGALAFRRFDRGSRRDSHPCSTPGHASWDFGKSKRALPALSCPSPVTAPHASAVVPKGMMPKAAPERVASPRGGTALAPLPKVPSRRRPSMSEIKS